MEEIKSDIANEDETEDLERLKEYLNSVKEAAERFGVKLPQDVDDPYSKSNPKDSIAGQELDYGKYRGPYGKESLRRYALNGTYALFKYARQNRAKFEAYEEVERRLLAFYRDMIQQKHMSGGVDAGKTEESSHAKWEDNFEEDGGYDAANENYYAADYIPSVKVEVNSYIESIRKGTDGGNVEISSLKPIFKNGPSTERDLIGLIRDGDKPPTAPQPPVVGQSSAINPAQNHAPFLFDREALEAVPEIIKGVQSLSGEGSGGEAWRIIPADGLVDPDVKDAEMQSAQKVKNRLLFFFSFYFSLPFISVKKRAS